MLSVTKTPQIKQRHNHLRLVKEYTVGMRVALHESRQERAVRACMEHLAIKKHAGAHIPSTNRSWDLVHFQQG